MKRRREVHLFRVSMSHERSREAAIRGFSLIELMVTIAIAGIIVSIAWVRMSTLVPIYRLEGAATDLATEIQKARGRAIAENKCFQVAIDTNAKTYQLQSKDLSTGCSASGTWVAPAGEGAKQIDDASSLTVAFSQGTNPTFNARGTLENNNPSPVVRLTNRAGAVRNVYVQSNSRIYVQ